MKKIIKNLKYSKAYALVLSILIIFLILLDLNIVSHEKEELAEHTKKNIKNELDLIKTFAIEPMLKDDFSTLERFIMAWGEKKESIVSLKAITLKGLVLVEYKREDKAQNTLMKREMVRFLDRDLIEIELVVDLKEDNEHLNRDISALLIKSLVITITVTLLVWLVMNMFALKPLEQEISKRIIVEGKLIYVQKELENKVRLRTKDLQQSNKELLSEIENRKKVEKDLELEKEQLLVTLKSIGDGVITIDVAGKIILMNETAQDISGWVLDEAIQRDFYEVFNLIEEGSRKRLRDSLKEVLNGNRIIQLPENILLKTKHGLEKKISNSVAPIYSIKNKIIGFVVVFRDITEKQKIEQELMKIKKLESVGILAGGLAHDFNNILVAILGNLSLAKEIVKSNFNKDLFDIIKDAEKASLNAKKLTTQLLTFAKGGVPVKKIVKIKEVIEESTTFILRGSNIRSVYDMPDDLWDVEVDPGQIVQVIQNIIINSKHAMPNGGTIEVKCENLKKIDNAIPSTNNSYIKISIRDHGVGISSTDLDRIFDPYFSTKEEGSGLGLAISHSIIKKHGGIITADSVENEGSIFSIYLISKRLITKDIEVKKEIYSETLLKKNLNILIMDDEEVVLKTLKKLLSKMSHNTILVRNGDEAISEFRKAQESNKKIDFIIMDITIPGGKGAKETIREILKLDESAKVVVSSGYSNDQVMANYKKYGFVYFLNKPYDIEDISSLIKKIDV